MVNLTNISDMLNRTISAEGKTTGSGSWFP